MRIRPTLPTTYTEHKTKRNLKQRRFSVLLNLSCLLLISCFIFYCYIIFITINQVVPNTFPNFIQPKASSKINRHQTLGGAYKSIPIQNNSTIGISSFLPVEKINHPQALKGTSVSMPIDNTAPLSLAEKQKPSSISVSTSKPSILKVFIVPNLPPSEATGEYNHFLSDGIERSSLMERSSDPYDHGSVWVVDLTKTACNRDVVRLVRDRWDHMVNVSKSDIIADGGHTGDKSTLPAPPTVKPWRIFLIDFGDDYYRGAVQCAESINTILNSKEKYLHFASRQTKIYRNIVHEKGESDVVPFKSYGKERNMRTLSKYFNGTMRVLRYGVRSDLVSAIEKSVGGNAESNNGSEDIVTMSRPKDVIHFWNHDSAQTGSASHRTFISKRLNRFARLKANANHTIFTGIIGEVRWKGRQTVQESYAKALLEYKIVVVCQRDRWEDHFRLMEGLAGGALVMTDPMHPLPYGLKNKEHVIVYHSVQELKQNIIFYLRENRMRLKIAKSGYEVAMQEHRSDKWMERMIYGNWSASDGAYL